MASKSISKSVLWQLIGKFFLQGLAFFTTPIFTRILSPNDYGYINVYGAWLALLTILISFEIQGSIGNARIKFPDIYKYLSSILIIPIVISSIFLIIVICFRSYFSNLLGLREDLIILMVLEAFFMSIVNCLIIKFDVFKQVEKSALFSIFQSIIILGLSLYFVLITKQDKGIIKIYAQAIPTILIGFCVIVYIYSRGRSFWNREYSKFCLTLTLPVIAHSVANIIFTQSDRIMLQKLVDNESVGIYSVCFSLSNILLIIYMAFNNAWVPFYYDYKKEHRETEIISHSKKYLKIMTGIFMGFLLLYIEVYKFLAPSVYWSGLKIVPILVISLYFGFLYLFPVNFEFYNCSTKLIPLGTIFSAIVNLIINYLLIPVLGIQGAAIGTFAAHFLLFVFHEISAARIIKVDYEYKILMFIPGILMILLTVLLVYFCTNLWYIRIGFALVLASYLLVTIIKQKSLF